MKRFRRWLFKGLVAFSMLLPFADAVFWARSYYVGDSWLWNKRVLVNPRPDGYYDLLRMVKLLRGRMWFGEEAPEFDRFIVTMPRTLGHTTFVVNPDAPQSPVVLLSHDEKGLLGFEIISYNRDTWAVCIPFWFLLAIFSVLPLIWIIRHYRIHSRVRMDRCSSCGYDLRATPDRCPECGKAVEKVI